MSSRLCGEKGKNVANERRGAAAIEFAFIAPVLFLVVFGLFEFSRMVMMQQSVTEAAQYGCRKAALATTNDGSKVETAVREYLGSVILNPSALSGARISISPSDLSFLPPGTPISVTVQVDFADVSWLPGNLIGLAGTEVLQSTSTLERE